MADTVRAVRSLAELGAEIGIGGDWLETYAGQDPHGGVDRGWPMGSLWSAEGRALYALARALPVRRAVEFGTHAGCSATHISQALADADREAGGLLDAIDVWEGAGQDIPDPLRAWVRLRHLDMCEYVDQALEQHARFELIFEDGPHDRETVGYVWRHARELLAPGGVIVSHDALHSLVGEAVRAGIESAGIAPVYVSLGGSDCGLAVWRNV